MGEWFFLPFPASRDHLHSLTYGFPSPSSKPATQLISDPASIITSLSPQLGKVRSLRTQESRLDPGESLHLKNRNLIASVKFLLPCKKTYSQVLGIRVYNCRALLSCQHVLFDSMAINL